MLRLARCVDAAVRCDSTTTAVTITDGVGKPVADPRFISMELILSNPVLAYGALGNSESHLMFCHDPLCVSPSRPSGPPCPAFLSGGADTPDCAAGMPAA